MSKWIDATEKLPETLGDVLVCLDDEGNAVPAIASYSEVNGWDCDYPRFGVARVRVSHWMPLPELPAIGEMYYLVRQRSTATNQNQSYKAGERVETIHGKDDKLLFMEGSYKGWSDTDLMTPAFVREYGYKRKSDAKRCWSYNNPDNSEHWKSEVSVISVEIRKWCGKEYLV